MKRHVAAVVLGVTAALVIDLHTDWHRADNGYLLRVGEHDTDPWGTLREAWNRATRSCGGVTSLREQDPAWTLALAAVRDYSPPDSRSARLVWLRRQGEWLLAEVASDTLLPALVTLRLDAGGMALVPRGVWSGNTAPWVAAPRIRDYLGRQVPGLPRALADCLEVGPDSPLQRPQARPPFPPAENPR